jgi:hypothetical protein
MHNVLREEARVLFVCLDSGSTQMALHYSDNSCYSEFVRHDSEARVLFVSVDSGRTHMAHTFDQVVKMCVCAPMIV